MAIKMNTDTHLNKMNLENMLSERSQTAKATHYTVCFHLYEMSRTVKSTDTESGCLGLRRLGNMGSDYQ